MGKLIFYGYLNSAILSYSRNLWKNSRIWK